MVRPICLSSQGFAPRSLDGAGHLLLTQAVSTFLQFTGMLDFLKRALESKSVRFARLNGTMSTTQRQAAIALYEAPNSGGKPVALPGASELISMSTVV
jgi:SNF2 family DNA or RNA helicase